jgi:hypothetical protein
MNIQTVAENLRNTIAGKEQHLLHLQQALIGLEMMDTTRTVIDTTTKFLVVNIDELKRILQDVEQCAKQDADDSWTGAVDRQGGSFTDEELDPNRGWK